MDGCNVQTVTKEIYTLIHAYHTRSKNSLLANQKGKKMNELIESLNTLKEMKKMYENHVHLCGNYYSEMMTTLNEQIKEVEKEIQNRKVFK